LQAKHKDEQGDERNYRRKAQLSFVMRLSFAQDGAFLSIFRAMRQRANKEGINTPFCIAAYFLLSR
jgi:hypothetical protein